MDDALFDYVRRAFGPGRLVIAPAERVEPLSIPERSRQFLLRVGLPTGPLSFGNELNTAGHLPTLAELYPDRRNTLDGSWEKARFLSHVNDTGIYLDAEDNGTIWEVDLLGRGDATFVNSSVEQFGYFLAVLNRSDPAWENAPPAARREMLAAMRRELREADPAALAGADCYWAFALEDASYYL